MIGFRSLPLEQQIKIVVAHLRLPVQLTLAPLYLWGVFGAGGAWSVATVGAFVAVHLFLYGGTTVFNSYYDRDDGPIAGLERPARLPRWALTFSLAWQGIGAVAALLIGPPLFLFYLSFAVVGALYSHPRTRLKARPYTSALLILLFQGCGGVTAGWLASRGGVDAAQAGRFALMALVAAVTTLGLYPLTQVYQIEEDAARGDRTLAMILGPARTFRFAIGAFGVAAILGLWALAAMGRPLDGILLVFGYAVMGVVVAAIGAQYARQPLAANYHRLVALQFGAAGGLAAFVALQFAHPF